MNCDDFLLLNKDHVFIKLTSENEGHFKTGINEYELGISFTDDKHVHEWLDCRKDLRWFRPVYLLKDTVIKTVKPGHYIVDRFYLLDRYEISSLPQETLEAGVLQAGSNIRFLNIQRDDICIAAVSQDPYAIKYIINQKHEYCMKALEEPHVIEHILDQKYVYCMKALQGDLWTFTYIRNMTDILWNYVLSHEPKLIEYCDCPTEKHCMLALRRDLSNLRLVYYKNYDFTCKILSLCGILLQYIPEADRDPEYCSLAVASMESAKKYCPFPS